MPDVTDVLNKVADQVELTDLLDRVHAGVRRRQRRRVVTGVTATVVVVAGVIAGVVGYSGNHELGTRPLQRPTPSTTAKPLSLAARLPRYLPPGVRLASQGPGGVNPAFAGVYHAVYAANGAAIRFAIIDDTKLRSCRSLSTVLTRRSFRVAKRYIPCRPDDHWFYPQDPLAAGYSQQINGDTAFLTEPTRRDHGHDIGLEDIEWRDGGYHYVLFQNRMTPGGGALDGVDFSELVKMAQSVPRDPSVPRSAALPNPPTAYLQGEEFKGLHRGSRTLSQNDGASFVFNGHNGFTVYVDPIDPPAGAANVPDGVGSDIDPAGAKRGTLVHLTVRSQPALAWISRHGGYAQLRCRIGGFSVGLEGGSHASPSIADLVRAANALRIIPHSP